MKCSACAGGGRFAQSQGEASIEKRTWRYCDACGGTGKAPLHELVFIAEMNARVARRRELAA